MQNEREEEVARRWKLEEEERARVARTKEGEEWRRVEEVMDDFLPEALAPKRKRIAGPHMVQPEVVDLVEGQKVEKTAVTAGRKRKGRG